MSFIIRRKIAREKMGCRKNHGNGMNVVASLLTGKKTIKYGIGKVLDYRLQKASESKHVITAGHHIYTLTAI
jgi:hypothetical protein